MSEAMSVNDLIDGARRANVGSDGQSMAGVVPVKSGTYWFCDRTDVDDKDDNCAIVVIDKVTKKVFSIKEGEDKATLVPVEEISSLFSSEDEVVEKCRIEKASNIDEAEYIAVKFPTKAITEISELTADTWSNVLLGSCLGESYIMTNVAYYTDNEGKLVWCLNDAEMDDYKSGAMESVPNHFLTDVINFNDMPISKILFPSEEVVSIVRAAKVVKGSVAGDIHAVPAFVNLNGFVPYLTNTETEAGKLNVQIKQALAEINMYNIILFSKKFNFDYNAGYALRLYAIPDGKGSYELLISDGNCFNSDYEECTNVCRFKEPSMIIAAMNKVVHQPVLCDYTDKDGNKVHEYVELGKEFTFDVERIAEIGMMRCTPKNLVAYCVPYTYSSDDPQTRTASIEMHLDCPKLPKALQDEKIFGATLSDVEYFDYEV